MSNQRTEKLKQQQENSMDKQYLMQMKEMESVESIEQNRAERVRLARPGYIESREDSHRGQSLRRPARPIISIAPTLDC